MLWCRWCYAATMPANGDILATVMASLGMKDLDVAARTGYASPTSIYRMRTGRVALDDRHLSTILHKMGVDPAEHGLPTGHLPGAEPPPQWAREMMMGLERIERLLLQRSTDRT